MKVKFKGEWYEIQCFNIKVKNGTGFITKDYEAAIEDIEINGAHLNCKRVKLQAVRPQDIKITDEELKEFIKEAMEPRDCTVVPANKSRTKEKENLI
jgi:hypothetical protein